VLVFLLAVTVVTHLPVVLLAVLVWLLWARRPHRPGMRRRYYR
jgi:hypothetical protein